MSEAKITPDEVRAHLRLDDDLSGEGELLKMYTDAALEACQMMRRAINKPQSVR